MSAQSRSRTPLQGLGRLGEGGRDDRLRFSLVVGILWRCVRLLHPVRWHVGGLCAGFAALALLLLPPGFLLYDLFWTRVLQGDALVPLEATLLGLDPATWVQVPALDPAMRRELARSVVVAGLAIGLVMVPAVIALYYYLIWILQRVNQVLRLELLDRLQALSLRFHAESRVGDAIYRLYQDSAMVTQLIDVLILTPISALGRFAFSLAVLAALDPLLAGVMACVWPPTLLIGSWFSRRMRVGFRRAREANSRLTSRIQETLSGIKLIKAYGAEDVEQRRFEESSLAAFEEAFAARNRFALYQVMIFWVLGSAVLTGIARATLRTHGDAEPAAQFLLVLGFSAWNLGLYNFAKLRLGDGADSGRELFRTWGRVQDIAIGLDRVFEILDLEPEVRDAPDAVPLEKVSQGIAFREVSFAYQPERPVLEGVSLEARVGTITALVGPTGSGKSTLMALLLRLFDPSKGRVEVDGVDLRHIRTASLRSRISIALQENVLFGDSVRENIRYAVPEASDEQVREAARVACADEFIQRLPHGYDTLLGERGAKLSSGQRQRLSIARAVLKDAPILLLDEPTASLDAATEIAVLRNLAEWGRGRAIFVVTHRLSTIRRADQIAVLREGRLVECGSHEELMARPRGAYRAMVDAEEVSPRCGEMAG
jgi:ABC-type multidrug transport system fused ATPase/permease subunit